MNKGYTILGILKDKNIDINYLSYEAIRVRLFVDTDESVGFNEDELFIYYVNNMNALRDNVIKRKDMLQYIYENMNYTDIEDMYNNLKNEID